MAQEKEGSDTSCSACGHTEPRISQVARDFQKSPLSQDLLTLPGIGKAAQKALQGRGITCTDQVLAGYFASKRNVEAYTDWLVMQGVGQRFARECAENVHRKLGAL
jgi:predicted flap endonuclease-1-like 5' DNA nuclease